MSQQYEKLKTLLKELFQLDQPDLDFGLYRVMHAKSAEVIQFLDQELLPQVKAAFRQYKTADKAEIEKELAKVVAGVEAAGMDSAQSPKVQELKDRLRSDAVDVDALEREVYDHLFSFFRRYYSEGDFLAKCVYKAGVYAIPYEGEEVTLYWANKDQYYIKTSEYLRDYAFRLRPDNDKKPMRVHFWLTDAAEGEHGNVKPVEGKERVFILAAPGESGRGFIAEEDGEEGKELVLLFQYRPATLTDWPEDARAGKSKPPAQKELIALAAAHVLSVTDVTFAPWIAELGKPHVTVGGEKADYTRLEAHLKRYTARNTFDYFIHKDLGGFLRRELDFYIKNEVMHLDDVENETAPRVEQYLSKIKVIRLIAGKIIDFLAQLEEFQKKLWLKKKFVVETQYCISLGCVPEELYAEIAANDAQRENWVRLFAIDEIKKDLIQPGYSIPLAVDFLKRMPLLVVDTSFFAATFTSKLLAAVASMDSQLTVLLVESHNVPALSLLERRFSARVAGVYIDPPYNTGSDGFVYRDFYQHSSWLTMIDNSLTSCRHLLSDEALVFVSVDDHEQHHLRQVLGIIFGEANVRGTITRTTGTPTAQGTDSFSNETDSLIVFGRSVEALIRGLPMNEKGAEIYNQTDALGSYLTRTLRKTGGEDRREDRPSMYFSVEAPDGTSVFPIGPGGYQSRWRVGPDRYKMLVGDDLIEWKQIEEDGVVAWKPYMKFYLEGRLRRPSNLWDDLDGNKKAQIELKQLFDSKPFPTPKPTALVKRVVEISTDDSDWIIDFFAGSGTTADAVIQLNQINATSRRVILVEQDSRSVSICRDRVLKRSLSNEWKDGKPTEQTGSSLLLKYIRLESYEDALNNLETRRTPTQQLLLKAADAQGADRLREQYLLRYMLDVETRGSQSLLNVQAFGDPTAYKLKVKRPGSDEGREVNVDLLETFNWLVGLTVQHIAAPQIFDVAFERDSEKRLQLKDRHLKLDVDGPYWFRTVSGTTPDGRKTLIIWRKLTGEPERDNLVLDEWFTKQGYSAKDSEFDLIYVNGGNNLENLKAPDDTWKVRLIEEDFHRLMFEAEGG